MRVRDWWKKLENHEPKLFSSENKECGKQEQLPSQHQICRQNIRHQKFLWKHQIWCKNIRSVNTGREGPLVQDVAPPLQAVFSGTKSTSLRKHTEIAYQRSINVNLSTDQWVSNYSKETFHCRWLLLPFSVDAPLTTDELIPLGMNITSISLSGGK